jgi:hypothetical protein
MKGKLKTLEKIKSEFKYEIFNKNILKVHHSSSCNWILIRDERDFGKIFNIFLYMDLNNRKLYRREGYSDLYYDEWFEWVGEFGPTLQNEFNNLINTIEGW